jgi:hypothetical protein
MAASAETVDSKIVFEDLLSLGDLFARSSKFGGKVFELR